MKETTYPRLFYEAEPSWENFRLFELEQKCAWQEMTIDTLRCQLSEMMILLARQTDFMNSWTEKMKEEGYWSTDLY